jgi:hypothetical protein
MTVARQSKPSIFLSRSTTKSDYVRRRRAPGETSGMEKSEVTKLFAEMDEKFFEGRLHREGWKLRWDWHLREAGDIGAADGVEASGVCDWSARVISLSSRLLDAPDGETTGEGEEGVTIGAVGPVLLHEMAHATVEETGHGWRFFREIERLRTAGAPVDASDSGPLSEAEEREEDEMVYADVVRKGQSNRSASTPR